MLNSLMNGSSLSNGLAQGIAATLAASNGGHQQPQTTSVGNGLKEFLLEQHQLVRHTVSGGKLFHKNGFYIHSFFLVKMIYSAFRLNMHFFPEDWILHPVHFYEMFIIY